LGGLEGRKTFVWRGNGGKFIKLPVAIGGQFRFLYVVTESGEAAFWA
jgi:hypothetical protein